MEKRNTIFFIGGTSATGKSTRVYCLIRFLESKGFLPTSYLTKKGKTYGRVYNEKLAIIGKEYSKNGKIVWQGVDVFTGLLHGEKGAEEMYDTVFEIAEKYYLIMESAGMCRTFRSRPLALEEQNRNVNTYTKFYFYKTVEDYGKRLAERGGKAPTETSPMWISNKSFSRQAELCMAEYAQCKHPERYSYPETSPFEPVWTIGEAVLKTIGMEDLVDEFKKYSTTFIEDTKGVEVSEGELF